MQVSQCGFFPTTYRGLILRNVFKDIRLIGIAQLRYTLLGEKNETIPTYCNSHLGTVVVGRRHGPNRQRQR
jgi:hypothetical protein